MTQVWELDACAIADAVRSRQLRATEVLDVFRKRIETFNDELNAFVHVDIERAGADAAEIDRRIGSGEDPGPLAGVPIGVKDLEDVAGMPTRYGSVPYADNVATSDAVHIARLRAAGCVIVGKTATPEFGSVSFTSTPLHGHTRNPWNLERTPGGSSGGSAAAVLAALVPLATGSDGGGSIRIPASYSGLVGPKGTYGRIPRGSGAEASYTSHYGPLSRTVRDSARFLDCTMGAHERDQFSLPHPGFSYEAKLAELPQGLRATWSDDLGFGACAREVATTARDAAETLVSTAGLRWVERSVELEDPAGAWGMLGRPTGWLQVERFWPECEHDLTPVVRMGVRAGLERLNVQELARAAERRFANNRILADVFDDVDIIITPATSTTAFMAEGPMPSEIDGKRISPMHSITFTYPFNLSGHPAVSVPCGFDSQGLPVGLQIVARRHDDHVLLALASAFERARPWPHIPERYAS